MIMNRYIKSFLHRGLVFSGFGPIVAGIVYFCISLSLSDFSLTGGQTLLAIVSTYIIAFVHAGASVFNQIDEWPLTKSIFWHFASLYLAYVLCYLVNTWIPFEWGAVGIFTAVFAGVYFVVWLVVFLSIKSTEKQLNKKLNKT